MEDVKEQAEQTAVESSIDETTTQEPTQEAPATAQAEDLESKTVPYNRLREEIEKRNDLQRRLEKLEQGQPATQVAQDPQVAQVKEELRKLGFVSQDDIQQTLNQERANQRVAQQLDKLEGQFNGQDGRPKFDRNKVVQYALDKGFADPEEAYHSMHRKELIDWHIKQAVAKSTGVKSEASDGSGSTEAAGSSNDDLKRAAIDGDANARRTFIKRLIQRG